MTHNGLTKEPPHRLSTCYQLGVQSLRKIKISLSAPMFAAAPRRRKVQVGSSPSQNI